MFIRTAPWSKAGQSHLPLSIIGWNGIIQSYEEYMSIFCQHSRAELEGNRELRKRCTIEPSAEDGTLAALVDSFLVKWDGLSVFDVHLKLQVCVRV